MTDDFNHDYRSHEGKSPSLFWLLQTSKRVVRGRGYPQSSGQCVNLPLPLFVSPSFALTTEVYRLPPGSLVFLLVPSVWSQVMFFSVRSLVPTSICLTGWSFRHSWSGHFRSGRLLCPCHPKGRVLIQRDGSAGMWPESVRSDGGIEGVEG